MSASEQREGRPSMARTMRIALRHVAEGSREAALAVICRIADAELIIDPEGLYYVARTLVQSAAERT